MQSFTARRILIVDDDEVVANLLASLLSDAGYASVVIRSPEDAQGAQGTYDLVISDYLAPSFVPGEPWPYLEDLRRLSGGGPVIGCTAHQDAVFDHPSDLGVAAVVVKPFDLDHVLATVERFLDDAPANDGVPAHAN